MQVPICFSIDEIYYLICDDDQGKGKSWSPPHDFGMIVPEMVLQHKGPDGIDLEDGDLDTPTEEEQDDNATHAMPTRQLSAIMAKMEERIFLKIHSSIILNQISKGITLRIHQSACAKRQPQSAMSPSWLERIWENMDWMQICQPPYAVLI